MTKFQPGEQVQIVWPTRRISGDIEKLRSPYIGEVATIINAATVYGSSMNYYELDVGSRHWSWLEDWLKPAECDYVLLDASTLADLL